MHGRPGIMRTCGRIITPRSLMRLNRWKQAPAAAAAAAAAAIREI